MDAADQFEISLPMHKRISTISTPFHTHPTLTPWPLRPVQKRASTKRDQSHAEKDQSSHIHTRAAEATKYAQLFPLEKSRYSWRRFSRSKKTFNQTFHILNYDRKNVSELTAKRKKLKKEQMTESLLRNDVFSLTEPHTEILLKLYLRLVRTAIRLEH